ncbi:MAG TPA: peroxiredoxin [Rhizomicrobium sp.]|jgi:peroxiredoxin|nr:peroxiredoxin [Rhizomicrobium sp.]
MKKIAAAVLLTVFAASPAYATLKVGDKAPDFSAQASLGGKEFNFSLADALKKGPVVLYFYPAAFTKGCTIEAHDFAEATDRFKKMGATVIGISHDKIDTLNKFSVSDCRSKFAVVADPDGKVIESYDTKIPLLPYSSRTSYVISPQGEILMEYSDMKPDQHVAKTMEAVQKWEASHH